MQVVRLFRLRQSEEGQIVLEGSFRVAAPGVHTLERAIVTLQKAVLVRWRAALIEGEAGQEGQLQSLMRPPGLRQHCDRIKGPDEDPEKNVPGRYPAGRSRAPEALVETEGSDPPLLTVVESQESEEANERDRFVRAVPRGLQLDDLSP